MDVTAPAATEAFVARYARRHPVTATFAGLHAHSGSWPDWSPAGLEAQRGEVDAMRAQLLAHDAHIDPVLEADRQVALGALAIEAEELDGTHMVRGNPSLWLGETAFGLIGLMHDRDCALDPARHSAALMQRIAELPAFLDAMPETIVPGAMHPAVLERAQRELDAVDALVARGVPAWLHVAGGAGHDMSSLVSLLLDAQHALERTRTWLDGLPPSREAHAGSAGPALFARVLADGHECAASPRDLLVEARDALAEATATLDVRCAEAGVSDYMEAQRRLAADVPDAGRYLAEYEEAWHRCASAGDRVIPMPRDAFEVVFEPIPAWAREASPALYYLYYRSPAPWKWPARYRYEVPWIDGLSATAKEAKLRQWNRSQLRLNHVVHHACLGHHRQNWAQARARGPVARLAAVDGASRLALAAGGTMAEGWSCYAVELYEELGLLSPLERVAEQHTRVRICARAVADLLLHAAGAPLEDVAALYERKGLMTPAAAHAEAVKNAIFPGMAIMYWLGTRTIHAARATASRQPGFDLRAWHERLLSYGALPLPTVMQLMQSGASA
ncbi:MAG: DUF885 domain-containing protein [Gemmatimonadaceae bacterium]|nr:DUF885 domain-containing protein [Gemmatimonadaceae bacterium]